MAYYRNNGCGCLLNIFYVIVFLCFIFGILKNCKCSTSNNRKDVPKESYHDKQVRMWHEQQIDRDIRNGNCTECHGKGYIIFCHKDGAIVNCKLDNESSRHDHVTCKKCGGTGKSK